MQHDATHPEQVALSSVQEKALMALLSGKTMTDAATDAGVHRSTIHRWINEPAFLAELNSRRIDQHSAMEEQLALLLRKAIETVESAIESGDAKVALTVLQGAGLLAGRRRYIGSTDPEQIQLDQAIAQQDKELINLFQ